MAPSGDDDITTGELARNLRDIRSDISQWRGELTRTLAGFVTQQLYQSEITAIRTEMARIEAGAEARDQAHERDMADLIGRQERWKLAFFTGILAPIIVALIVGAFVIQKVG
jgi:hypothetical protein